MSYENLMRPIRIQNMTLRNRVMMAPMGTNLANPDGSISEEHKTIISSAPRAVPV